MRRGALLNDAQLSGMLPTSVGGGENAPGNWSLMAGFCGPGSVMLLGFLALIAPCGGSFGLPNVISLFTGVAAFAVVIVAAVTSPPAAVAASMSPLENIVCTPFTEGGSSTNQKVIASFPDAIKLTFRIVHPRERCQAFCDCRFCPFGCSATNIRGGKALQ